MNLLLSLLLFFFLLSVVPSKSEEPSYFKCSGDNKTDGNPQISNIIKQSLSKLVANTIKYGFSTTSIVEEQSKINGLAQCRGDVSANDCSSCIKNASVVIRDSKHCPNQSEAIIMYDFCLLRYSTKDFYNEVDPSLGITYLNTGKVTHAKHFNESLMGLMANISKDAVKPDQKGMGKGKTSLYKSPNTLYAFVQCTRDLTELRCQQCLAMATNSLLDSCRHHEGCRVLLSSCYLRYEIYTIYNENSSIG